MVYAFEWPENEYIFQTIYNLVNMFFSWINFLKVQTFWRGLFFVKSYN